MSPSFKRLVCRAIGHKSALQYMSRREDPRGASEFPELMSHYRCRRCGKEWTK